MSQLSLPWPLGSLMAGAGAIAHAGWGWGLVASRRLKFHALPWWSFHTQGSHSRSMRVMHRIWMITLTNICFPWHSVLLARPHALLGGGQQSRHPGIGALCLCIQLSSLPPGKPTPLPSTP